MSCLSRNSSYDHARGDIINGGGGEGGRIPFGLHTVLYTETRQTRDTAGAARAALAKSTLHPFTRSLENLNNTAYMTAQVSGGIEYTGAPTQIQH